MEISKAGSDGKQALDSKGSSLGRRAKDDPVEGRKMKLVQIAILCIIIFIVWGLLLIPIIFYYLPLSQEGEEDNKTDLELINATNGRFACRENFYREPTFNICVPHCPNWRQDPKAESITVDVVVFFTYFTGFVASIGILIISTIRREAMFAFPNSLVVYMTIVYFFQDFLYIITFFDRAKLYCSSENLLETFLHVTPFCAISGMVQAYSSLSISLWWFMLTAALFWRIWFPMHAKSFQVTRKIKYIHVGCCLLGLLLPLIPVIAIMISFAVEVKSSGGTLNFFSGGLGFYFINFPPIGCNGRYSAILFYSVILPTDLLLATSITLTILLFWIIHKKHGLFREIKSKYPFKISNAERKLLVIICYVIVSTVVILTSYTRIIQVSPITKIRLDAYFSCEQFGHDPDNPCPFETTVPVTLVILISLLYGTLPLVNLIFALNIEDLKRIYHRRFKQNIISRSSRRTFNLCCHEDTPHK